MIYLKRFLFASEDDEDDAILRFDRTFNNCYPFRIFPAKNWERIDFSDITILNGSNGSGKSTALNVIAEKIQAQRECAFNRSGLYERYIALCQAEFAGHPCREKKIIASDDVFNCMIDLRLLNSGVETKRLNLFDEYAERKHKHFQLKSLDQLDELRRCNAAKSKSRVGFVRPYLAGGEIVTRSNGESALQYFSNKIDCDGLYLLDEPENSLSPKKQLELKQFIEDSVRFYHCQFIIATHSPFLLSLKEAVIYDLDGEAVKQKAWTELECVRTYRSFFAEHEAEF